MVDLAAAFDASPNPYVLLRPDLTIAGMNSVYLEVTHSRREDLVGQPIFGKFDSGPGEDAPENVRQVRASMLKAIETKGRDHLAVVRYTMPRTLANGEVVFKDRYWSATHTAILNEQGDVVFLLQHTSDITDLEELRRSASTGRPGDLSALDVIASEGLLQRAKKVQADNRRLEVERNRLVEMFMQAPGFVAVLSGPEHVFQMHNDAYAQLIGHRDIAGKTIRAALPELEGQNYFEFLDSVYETGEPYEGRESRAMLQRERGADLEEVFVNFIYQPIRDPHNKVVGIFVQGHDVTDNVQAAQRQKLMIDELNHRVKNTLATVQSIAMQTARSNTEPRAFAESFQARLMSLSHTHDLLTRSHWEGAELADILRHETEAHETHRVSANGPHVSLGSASALSLGMIFHELATNAAKYGALSSPQGRVIVDWSIADQTDRRLILQWTETGGPEVLQPERRGFGSRMIERNVRHDLAGEVELSYAPDGLRVTISIPLDRGLS